MKPFYEEIKLKVRVEHVWLGSGGHKFAMFYVEGEPILMCEDDCGQ